MLIDLKSEYFVFVFGSNLAGVHGKGAAYDAATYFGAVKGVGQGLTGRSYALPTKDHRLNILTLKEIELNICDFFNHANANPHKTYFMTRVGCGLAGYEDADISSLVFKYCGSVNALGKAGNHFNVYIPGRWLSLQSLLKSPRIIVAGTRTFNNYEKMKSSLNHLLGRFIESGMSIEIVSGAAKGADTLGEHWAEEFKQTLMQVPAPWDYGKGAGFLRNKIMSAYSTHLVAFWDGKSPGTDMMIKTAMSDGLEVRTINYAV